MTFGKTLFTIGIVATVLKVCQLSGFVKGAQSVFYQIPESADIKELSVKFPLGKKWNLMVTK